MVKPRGSPRSAQPRRSARNSAPAGPTSASAPNTPTGPARRGRPVNPAFFAAAQGGSFLDTVDAEALERKPVGVVWDERFDDHRCEWDERHQESPARTQAILHRCRELGLLDAVKQIPAREALDVELRKVHDGDYLAKLDSLCAQTDVTAREVGCSAFPFVYVAPESASLARLAAGGCIDMVQGIVRGELQSGFAFVRPPGHHASRDTPRGFCLINNAVVAAKAALAEQDVNRVLIIDIDVHDGNGTRNLVVEDPRIQLVNVHRFERGAFWPMEGAAAVGKDEGSNILNIPLEETGLTNSDYLALWFHLVLPAAFKSNPDIVLVSFGTDAAMNDPEGLMRLSPSLYAHLVRSLMSLANGKVALVLEGGYDLDSLSEACSLALGTLCGCACPTLPAFEAPKYSTWSTVAHILSTQHPMLPEDAVPPALGEDPFLISREVQLSRLPASPEKPPFDTRDTAPPAFIDREKIDSVQSLSPLPLPGSPAAFEDVRVGLATDKQMAAHVCMDGPHPERPERLTSILNRLDEKGVSQRCQSVASRACTDEEVLSIHERSCLELVRQIPDMDEAVMRHVERSLDSIYICPATEKCARLAYGTLVNLTDWVLDKGDGHSGVAVIRPPGHHAEKPEPSGFCFFNNVAGAAQHALDKRNIKRILVVDWDVHHGNGIQNIFLEDPRVLYVSIHLYLRGQFYPGGQAGSAMMRGEGLGQGFNINVPWEESRMGDPDYISAFLSVLLPAAYQFDPELVFVSAGFDAARGDPLGMCKVSPECFGVMTNLLLPLASGKVILALEGGYNLNSISESLTLCTKACLGDPSPRLTHTPRRKTTPTVLENVTQLHADKWLLMLPFLTTEGRAFLDDQRFGLKIKLPKVQTKSEKAADLPSPAALDDLAGRMSSMILQDSRIPLEAGTEDNPKGQASGTESKGGPRPRSPSLEPKQGSATAQPPLTPVNPPAKKGPSPPPTGAELPAMTEDYWAKLGHVGATPKQGSRSPSVKSEKSGRSGSEEEEPGPSSGQAAGYTPPEDVLALLAGELGEVGGLYAVIPLPSCPHLSQVAKLGDRDVDVYHGCDLCPHQGENWLCLSCYSVLCSRYVRGHMVDHYETTGHSMCLSYADLSVWCYPCDSYVHNEVLLPMKRAAHRSKFGEDMPEGAK